MARKKADQKDVDFEIRFYEGIVKRSPNFFQALSALGDLYAEGGYYQKGLMIDQKLATLQPDNPMVLYNLSCSYALLHDMERALQAMKQAIERGYHDFDYLEKDTDLKSLRDNPEFKHYYAHLKNQKTS